VSNAPEHFCFILEEEYRNSRLPMAVVRRLTDLGHRSTVLEPSAAPVAIDQLLCRPSFSAAVLRTVSGGPGLNLLQALGAAGVRTINDADAVSRVRDKVVMAAVARASRIPVPATYFVATPRLLSQIPEQSYPLVVKPSTGGFGRSVRLVRTPLELDAVAAEDTAATHLVAQTWVPNSGDDVKLYNTGQAIHAVRRRSSLQGGTDGEREPIRVSDELRELASAIGRGFGLEIYGADVVEGPDGWVVIDVNDFPSFGKVDSAPDELAASILEIAKRPRSRGRAR
jgi:ribosomal protein S6--L-glutamate ligase